MDSATIKRRVAARDAAKEILEFAGECLRPDSMDEEAFWLTIAEAAANTAGKEIASHAPAAPQMMSDEEAARFEKSAMPYGRFVGEPVADVDCEYLAFLLENRFAKDLARYCRSPYYRRKHGLAPAT